MQGTSKDLASYMARVKVLAAKEGVKPYGAATKTIIEAHKAGHTAERCAEALVKREDALASVYASLPRVHAAAE